MYAAETSTQQQISTPMGAYTTDILLAGIALGSLIGYEAPSLGSQLASGVDYIVFLLVAMLFFELRFDKLVPDRADMRFLLITWMANFVLIPIIGYGIASLFLEGRPLAFAGLFIYFMAPCTDWMLGFTKLAGGNVDLGAKLIPINMISQLFLYPFYIHVFVRRETVIPEFIWDTFLHWFITPLVIALLVRSILQVVLPSKAMVKIRYLLELSIPYTIFLLVTVIFSAHIQTVVEQVETFLLILAAVFIFFVATFIIGESLSKLMRLRYPERTVLAMSTAARNAPLMLAITIVAFPNQPMIYAALVIGMLVEFPHLTLLCRLLVRSRD